MDEKGSDNGTLDEELEWHAGGTECSTSIVDLFYSICRRVVSRMLDHQNVLSKCKVLSCGHLF